MNERYEVIGFRHKQKEASVYRTRSRTHAEALFEVILQDPDQFSRATVLDNQLNEQIKTATPITTYP